MPRIVKEILMGNAQQSCCIFCLHGDNASPPPFLLHLVDVIEKDEGGNSMQSRRNPIDGLNIFPPKSKTVLFRPHHRHPHAQCTLPVNACHS